MADGLDDLGAFARAERGFHQTLAEAADNAVLMDLLHVIRSLLQAYADRAMDDREAAAVALREHEAILQAISAADEDAAASTMAVHMATASERLRAEF